ncbi:hypothetical protein M1P56_09755 [Streptomyces sp. HU2014]|uniref:hypothetical protein n=1 Tax=Streptomyces sp. HU2014 TaxID=2939414 RepID=UPI00200C090E|nr:hypothetical protein [Streptomyces sp. HU2014]UQI44610.1 hypothetical protein M1P56_09755 [Streptomyces sp. HU2014]
MIHVNGIADVTYQAAWSPEEQEVTVIKNVRAGISGPFGDWPAVTQEAASQVLAQEGYHVVGAWVETRTGQRWANIVFIGRGGNL